MANQDSNALVSFINQATGSNIRIQMVNGEHWFCLADVLDGTGSSTQPHIAKASVQDEFGDGGVIVSPIADALGRDQETTFISEPALYYLLSRGRTEGAKLFRRWVFGDVIPQIRKTGQYSVQQQQPVQPVLKVHTAVEYIEASKTLETIQSSMLKSLLNQRLMEELSALQPRLPENTEPAICILTVRAEQLGVPRKLIGGGGDLGKYVKRHFKMRYDREPLGKQQHGRYSVHEYPICPEIDNLILEWRDIKVDA